MEKCLVVQRILIQLNRKVTIKRYVYQKGEINMNEVTMMSNESRDIVKIKVKSAEIVVHGTIEKPYYEIEYYCIDKEEGNIGYSSYDLNNVFRWLNECFEIVNEDTTVNFDNDLIGDGRVKNEIIGTVRTDGYNWYFETEEELYTADVPTALDELLGTDTEEGDKYRITIEKIS